MINCLNSTSTSKSNDSVIIVASGPSVSNIDPSFFVGTDATIIAVNGSSDWLPTFDAFFTLDCSPSNIRRICNQQYYAKYYVACDTHQNFPSNVTTLSRLSAPTRHISPVGTASYWFHRWGCLEGLSDDPNAIHTGNSAYGALGLAYHWNPNKILFLGVDGTQEPRVNNEGPPKYNLYHLPLLFDTATSQLKEKEIEVVNGSTNSKIKCFTKMNHEEAFNWINQ